MRENTDQKNSKYGHFLRHVYSLAYFMLMFPFIPMLSNVLKYLLYSTEILGRIGTRGNFGTNQGYNLFHNVFYTENLF